MRLQDSAVLGRKTAEIKEAPAAARKRQRHRPEWRRYNVYSRSWPVLADPALSGSSDVCSDELDEWNQETTGSESGLRKEDFDVKLPDGVCSGRGLFAPDSSCSKPCLSTGDPANAKGQDRGLISSICCSPECADSITTGTNVGSTDRRTLGYHTDKLHLESSPQLRSAHNGYIQSFSDKLPFHPSSPSSSQSQRLLPAFICYSSALFADSPIHITN